MHATTSRLSGSRRRSGVGLAGATAIVSGFAVFLNGYGVRAWSEVTTTATYTTLKNLLAAAILIAVPVLMARRGTAPAVARPTATRQWLMLLTIAVIGGSVPFLLFFEGLARASSGQAAFIHKTLVIWVTVLAIAFLKERIGPLHIAAVVLLVWGQAALLGGVTGLTFGTGEWMMLAATLLWSAEVIVAKKLLADVPPTTVAIGRMAGGAVVLLAYAAATGAFAGLSAVGAAHVGWIALTGLVLAAYVGTWYAALSRAQAADVTAMLVGGAVITALLNTGVRSVAVPPATGLVLLTVGVAAVAVAMWRAPAR